MPTARMATSHRRSIMGLTQKSPMSHILGIRSGAMKDEAYGYGDTRFAQITHDARSASRKDTPLLPVCCLCKLIRDEIGASPDRERWISQRTYRKTHGINPANCLQTHTYCPGCFTQVMETIRTAQVMTTLAVA
jgi:hypothetical protein